MKKQFKSALILIILSAVLICLAGCGDDPPSPQNDSSDDERIRIGFSMATLIEDRWLQDRDIFLAIAQQRNIDVLLQNANLDSDLQLEQVMDMLEKGIDVLVIVPNDTEKAAKCVRAARERNVPVIMYDRLIQNTDADVYISFDNYQVGVLMAEYLLEEAPSGGYMLVNGPKTDFNTSMIRDGYMDTLKPHIEDGSIEILFETWTEGWVRENAYDYVSKHLPDYADRTVAAICQNDSLAWGVIDALSEARMLHNVKVVGMDADLTACQRVVKDMQGMTVYKPIHLLVEETINTCEKLASEEKLTTNRTVNNGMRDIPYIAIDVVMVTKDNMQQTVIQDGFHLEEDIYH